MLGLTEIALILVIVAVLAAAVFGAVTIARKKGRDPVLWGLLVLAFMPFLLVIALLPRVDPSSR